MKLSKENLVDIKKFIDQQLRVRCIDVETTLKVVKDRWNKDVFELTSTIFRTVPNIHGDMELQPFSQSIKEVDDVVIISKDDEDIQTKKVHRLAFYLEVYVSYSGNCQGIFGVHGFVNKVDKQQVWLSLSRQIRR